MTRSRRDSAAADVAVRRQARHSRRAQIRDFFVQRLGQRFSSAELHSRFGSAFRTRVSELNRDLLCPIRILNETLVGHDDHGEPREQSTYWSELRDLQKPTAPVADWYEQANGPRPKPDAEDTTERLPLFERGAA